MFLRGNLAAHGTAGAGHPHATTFHLWRIGGDIHGVLGVTQSGMVLCQCPDGKALTGLAPALEGATLTGFSGDADQTGRLIDGLGLTGADFRLNHVEPLFRLDLADLKDRGDTVRCPTPEEAALLRGWFADYMRDTGLGAGDPASGVAEATARAEAAVTSGSTVRLLGEAGQPVAMAALNATAGDVVQVGGVFVPPDHRGTGLGRRVTAALLAEARDKGARIAVLFANNAAASRAYQAIGFGQVGWYRIAFLAEPVVP